RRPARPVGDRQSAPAACRPRRWLRRRRAGVLAPRRALGPLRADRRTGRPPVITIDTASAVPPYEQVRSQLAAQISDRTLAVGTRLPTVRRLGADLGVAV